MNLPTAEAATGQLNKLYSDVFFGNLSHHGLTPTTEKEANDLIGAAGELNAIANGQVKTASANAILNVLNRPATSVLSDEQIMKVARDLAADPEVYHAALSTLVAETLVADGQPAATVYKQAYTLESVIPYIRQKLSPVAA